MKLSIIMPVLNEANIMVDSLIALQPFRASGHELIVVDGGSIDASVPLSRVLSDQVILAPRGRSKQMNAGAYASSGEILLFLHADTFLPERADQWIVTGMKYHGRKWGYFDVRLSGNHLLFRCVERLINLRSRLSGIATGDQGIFVCRKLFEAVGGFPDIELMEDIALSKRLKRHGPPLCLRQPVLTSSRRWEKRGILRTVLLMWFLRLAYFMKANPKHLAQLYR